MPQNDRTIGIVGGYGSIGVYVAEELAKTSGCRLLIGGRNREKIDRLVGRLGQCASGMTVDVTRGRSLDDFCGKCSIVVNCTGPSWIIRDTVVSHALKAGCDYVDPGIWYDADGRYAAQFEARGLSGLLYAGWIPGITGMLPRYLFNEASRTFESIASLNIFCGDRSGWSENATYDIIYHFIRGIQTGYFSHGSWRRKSVLHSLLGSKYYRYPGAIGSYIVSPGYTIELESLAREASIPCLTSYAGIVGLYTLLKMLFIRYSTIGDEKATALLMKALKREADAHGSGGAVCAEITGIRNGRKARMTAAMFNYDTIRLTGLCTAVAVAFLMKGAIDGGGLRFLCDAVDPAAFLNRVAAYGISFSMHEE